MPPPTKRQIVSPESTPLAQDSVPVKPVGCTESTEGTMISPPRTLPRGVCTVTATPEEEQRAEEERQTNDIIEPNRAVVHEAAHVAREDHRTEMASSVDEPQIIIPPRRLQDREAMQRTIREGARIAEGFLRDERLVIERMNKDSQRAAAYREALHREMDCELEDATFYTQLEARFSMIQRNLDLLNKRTLEHNDIILGIHRKLTQGVQLHNQLLSMVVTHHLDRPIE